AGGAREVAGLNLGGELALDLRVGDRRRADARGDLVLLAVAGSVHRVVPCVFQGLGAPPADAAGGAAGPGKVFNESGIAGRLVGVERIDVWTPVNDHAADRMGHGAAVVVEVAARGSSLGATEQREPRESEQQQSRAPPRSLDSARNHHLSSAGG